MKFGVVSVGWVGSLDADSEAAEVIDKTTAILQGGKVRRVVGGSGVLLADLWDYVGRGEEVFVLEH